MTMHAPGAPWSPMPDPYDGLRERIDRYDLEIAKRALPYPALVIRGHHIDRVEKRGEGDYVLLRKKTLPDGSGGGEIMVDRRAFELIAIAFGERISR